MRTVVAVGVGGFLGTVCRYLMTLIPISEKTAFPVVTLTINILGSLLIGILAGLTAKYEGINADLMAFLRVGICGGFTTFSTFALESVNLMGNGKMWIGVAYMALSLILGIAAVLTGKAIAA